LSLRPTITHRSLSALVLFALALSLVVIAPASQASAEGFEATVFRSGFQSLSTGALSATPVAVEEGFVLAATAPVAVASVSGLEGQALTVSGAGVAELRFSSYPDALPQALNSQRYELRVRADLLAPVASAEGASLYLMTVGGQRYEIVGFGADGKLARGGTALNMAYTAGSKVEVDARFDLKNGVMELELTTSAGSLQLDPLILPGNFNPDSVGRLHFAAGGASGSYGIDQVEVTVQKEDKEKEDPARIVITPPATNTVSFEEIGDVTLINFNIVLKNNGGRARNVFLVLDVDDDLIELLDLSWVSGVGYVQSIGEGQIVIGIGEYNAIRKDSYDLKFKFKLKQKRNGEVKIDIKYRVRYHDSRGRHESGPLVIPIIIPMVIVPITATPVVTGTPATATPTVTGTPPTATATAPATVTATPTVTGTPPTATPTAAPGGPSPTPTSSGS
jgi:hypothetical protein